MFGEEHILKRDDDCAEEAKLESCQRRNDDDDLEPNLRWPVPAKGEEGASLAVEAGESELEHATRNRVGSKQVGAMHEEAIREARAPL